MDETPLSDTPDQPAMAEPGNLRFLRVLVTILTATMILGLLAIMAMLVIRFTREPAPFALPATITVPDGARVLAFTRGSDWYAVVTDRDTILIYDAGTGALRQSVRIKPAAP